MEELVQALRRLGLSEKEGAVYVAGLSIGPGTIQQLASASRVNRATTYLLVESLMRRGLMSTVEKGTRRLYVSETPERLNTWLETERRGLLEKEEHLKETLPMLFALFNTKAHKPSVRYLEGQEGLRTVREMFLKESGEFIQLVPFQIAESHQDLREGQSEHWRSLSEAEVPHRALLLVSDVSAVVPTLPGGEVRTLAHERFPIQSEISVRGNTVFLYAFRPAILSIVLTSRELADAVRALFDLAWIGAAPEK